MLPSAPCRHEPTQGNEQLLAGKNSGDTSDLTLASMNTRANYISLDGCAIFRIGTGEFLTMGGFFICIAHFANFSLVPKRNLERADQR